MSEALAEVPNQIQRFVIRGVLGAGAMGIVYRAHDPQLDREVAIKVVSGTPALPDLTQEGTLDLRAAPRGGEDLLREARVMAQLSDPHVLAIYEVGLLGDSVFLVMELVIGASLREWLGTTRDVTTIADVLAQAARGLAAAHARGIVHRDFKLDNVLIGEDGRARVGDFGISRLLERRTAAMVRVGDDVGGTPGYMAPELWAGQPATAATDSYALCVSCIEALAGVRHTETAPARRDLLAAGVLAPTADVLLRGLASDPPSRPSAVDVARALSSKARRSKRWPWMIASALVVGVGGVGVARLANLGPFEPEDPCADAASLTAARWAPISRVAVSAAWIARSERDQHTRLLSMLDQTALAIEAGAEATCRARERGEVTADDAARRTACLARRAYEHDALTGLHRALPEVPIDKLLQRVDAYAEQTWCEVASATKITDPAAAERLLADYVQLRTQKAETQAVPLAELEARATSAGEQELAVRVAINLGDVYAGLDRARDADQTLQRAYKLALEARLDDLAALAMTRRSDHESRRDPASAKRTAELALELIERPGIALRSKVRAHAVLGRAQRERGDIEAAIASLRTALTLAGDAPFLRATILAARSDLVNALGLHDRSRDKAVEEAREYVRLAKAWVGERSPEYGTALNVLALALRRARGPEESLPYRKQALVVMEASLSANHSRVIGQRTDLASDLQALGRSEEAYAEFHKALELSKTNETTKAMRATYLAGLGSTSWGMGHGAEALRWMELAVQAWTEQRGSRHDDTLRGMRGAADMAIQLGKLDTASRYVQLIEEGYAENADRNVTSIATFRGTLAADLALAQRDYRGAELLTRQAIATLDELKRDDARALILWRRGESLTGLGKFAAAGETLALARKQMEGYKERADRVAIVDLALAKLESARGDRVRARALARAVLEVLESYPGQPRARLEATALGK
ncbi:MAG: protein kinase domain-containing protein [Kofleriaceae bacterium]